LCKGTICLMTWCAAVWHCCVGFWLKGFSRVLKSSCMAVVCEVWCCHPEQPASMWQQRQQLQVLVIAAAW
jgi:hypothetical protein